MLDLRGVPEGRFGAMTGVSPDIKNNQNICVDGSFLAANVRRPPQEALLITELLFDVKRSDSGSKKKGVDGHNPDDNVRRPRKTGNWIERVF